MELKVLLSLFIMTFGSAFSSVEEGRAATLQCPGFTPTPGGDLGALFIWYKARVGDVPNGNVVAFLSKRDGVVNSYLVLDSRATIDSTTGALHIKQTRVSDDHVYTCLFRYTSIGEIKDETNLTITVTPSEQDLQVTANPSGPVQVGESVTFNCSAPRVRPPPQEMYWQFTDETGPLGHHRNVANDNLTSSVSVQYSLTVSRSHHGRKLVCQYVSSTRNISSEEMAIQVLCSAFSSVTVEEGRAATLQCPGFTPTPGGDHSAVFNWYKAREGDAASDNRVAFLAKRDGVVNSERDLQGRATIDSTTGALQITQTTVSDDHVYSCIFFLTSMGKIENETCLTITVTPSEQDLQVTANPPGAVPVERSVTFNCTVPRVRPPPRLLYWQFTDEPQHFGDYRNSTNSDGLISSVSVQYSLTVSRSHHGRRLVCHYVSSRYISSNEMTIQVLSKPMGKPSLQANITVVKANTKISLRCDSSQLEGSATWFAWQVANGTVLRNTTQENWNYIAKEEEETLQFVCIAGNVLGQTDKSEPLMITIQNSEYKDLGLIIGMAICAGVTIAVIITGIVCFVRHRKVGDNITQTMTEYDVEYENEGPVPSALPRAMKNGTGLDYENRGVMVEGPRSSDDSTYTSLTK